MRYAVRVLGTIALGVAYTAIALGFHALSGWMRTAAIAAGAAAMWGFAALLVEEGRDRERRAGRG